MAVSVATVPDVEVVGDVVVAVETKISIVVDVVVELVVRVVDVVLVALATTVRVNTVVADVVPRQRQAEDSSEAGRWLSCLTGRSGHFGSSLRATVTVKGGGGTYEVATVVVPVALVMIDVEVVVMVVTELDVEVVKAVVPEVRIAVKVLVTVLNWNVVARDVAGRDK